MDIKGVMKDILTGPARRKHAERNELSAARIQDRYSTYPSNGLTPVRLARILREAAEGDVLAQMELFEEMEEKDPHLFSQLQTRKLAVTGLDFEVVAAGSGEMDKRIAEFVGEALRDIEGFEDILFDLLDAIGKGVAIAEILWKFDSERITVGDIRSRHQKRLRWDSEDRLRIFTIEHPEGLLIPENKFIIHRYKARSGHTARAGILRVVAWMYLFKNYDVKDWVSFCEVFGMPIRLGKYNPGASEEDKQALMGALVRIGSDAAGIIPDGTSIELKESQKSTSIDVYERLARYCDEQISKAVLGQTLTSDSGASGSYAQSKTHNEVRHDLTASDCKALASTLRRDLIRPLVLFNFGDGHGIPEIKFDAGEPEDTQALVGVVDTLVNKTGLRIPAGYAYEKFNIPRPGEGEEVLTPESGRRAAPEYGLSVNKQSVQQESQDTIDSIVDKCARESGGIFRRMFAPVITAMEEAESLEELKDRLENEELAGKIFREMEITDFEELLQRAMLMADLEGRVIEHEKE